MSNNVLSVVFSEPEAIRQHIVSIGKSIGDNDLVEATEAMTHEEIETLKERFENDTSEITERANLMYDEFDKSMSDLLQKHGGISVIGMIDYLADACVSIVGGAEIQETSTRTIEMYVDRLYNTVLTADRVAIFRQLVFDIKGVKEEG